MSVLCRKVCFNLTLSWCFSFLTLLFSFGWLSNYFSIDWWWIENLLNPVLGRGLQIILFHWQKVVVFMLLVSMILDSLVYQLIKITQLYDILALSSSCLFFWLSGFAWLTPSNSFSVIVHFFFHYFKELSFFSSIWFFWGNFIISIVCGWLFW